MSYVSCDHCRYQCRVAADLLGRQVLCPKCKHVVLVRAELSQPAQNDKHPASEESGQAAELYIGNIMKRRGPVSVSQLQILARWNLVGEHELITDESGAKQATVREFITWGGWPSIPETPKKTKRLPRLLQFQRSLSETILEDRAEITPVRRPVRRPERQPERRPERSPEPALEARSKDPDLTNDEFMAIIDRAVQMERQAQTVEIERTETPVEMEVAGPGARLVRTAQFAESYRLIAFVYIVNALICGLASTSTIGMFVKRLFQLSAGVFIPFEQGGELIEGKPLIRCGMALVLVCGQFVIPIWWLSRQDCVIWHCSAATFFGLLVGMAMKPEWLWFGFEAIRMSAGLSGLAVSAIAWHLSCFKHSDRVALRIRLPVVLTVFFSVLLTLVDMDSVFIADMAGLSPTIRGSGRHICLFAICFFGMMVSIPAVVLSLLYEESANVVRTFMMQKAVTVLIIGAVGGTSVMCIALPQAGNFLNVPMALLPIGCLNILAIITPPVLWLLDPRSSLSRY